MQQLFSLEKKNQEIIHKGDDKIILVTHYIN